MTIDPSAQRAIRTGAKYLADKGGKQLAAKVGDHVVRSTMQEAYKQALGRQLAQGAANPGVAALVSAATRSAGTRAMVERVVPVAGKAAGVLVGPAVEVGLMYFDGEEHTGREYTRAAGQAAASGAAGLLASAVASAVAGAAVGSVVPGAGTIVGFVAGAATSLFVNRKLKES